jgi:hypothetical protein
MIKAIFRQWKQPFSFTFSSGPAKSVDIKNMITEVITSCQDIGLKVVASICDQGTFNQAAINAFLKQTSEACLKAGTERRYDCYLINGGEVIHLYDVPHIFKGIRNNFLKRDLHFEINGISKVAKMKHIEQLYMLDTMDDTKLCTKLTDAHIFARKIKVSHIVIKLMTRISQWRK